MGGDENGLGLLPIRTLFVGDKRTVRVTGRSHAPWAPNTAFSGYEIHMGRTSAPAHLPPLLTIDGASAQPDGCVSADGRVWGCYIHGIFANDAFRRGWLASLGWSAAGAAAAPDPYERLADHVEAALDPRQLEQLLAR
jgi:adenosylcobyric acid synthase